MYFILFNVLHILTPFFYFTHHSYYIHNYFYNYKLIITLIKISSIFSGHIPDFGEHCLGFAPERYMLCGDYAPPRPYAGKFPRPSFLMNSFSERRNPFYIMVLSQTACGWQKRQNLKRFFLFLRVSFRDFSF
jgi:hypothetical protein